MKRPVTEEGQPDRHRRDLSIDRGARSFLALIRIPLGGQPFWPISLPESLFSDPLLPCLTCSHHHHSTALPPTLSLTYSASLPYPDHALTPRYLHFAQKLDHRPIHPACLRAEFCEG